VAEELAEAFAERLARRMAELRVGRGVDPDVDIGPLADAEQRDAVAELVEDALAGGARALTGGHAIDSPGYFYAPTVLDRLAPDARVLREEIFGPVAPVVPFRTEEDAIAKANATQYGLVAYLYTRDLNRALRVSEALETGMVG